MLRDWHGWLAAERRVSAHTLSAYTRELAGFLTFLAAHRGAVPALADLADLRPFYAARLAAAHVNTVTMPEETRHWFEVELTSVTAMAAEPDSPSPQTETTAVPAGGPEDDHRPL